MNGTLHGSLRLVVPPFGFTFTRALPPTVSRLTPFYRLVGSSVKRYVLALKACQGTDETKRWA